MQHFEKAKKTVLQYVRYTLEVVQTLLTTGSSRLALSILTPFGNTLQTEDMIHLRKKLAIHSSDSFGFTLGIINKAIIKSDILTGFVFTFRN